MDDYGCCVNIHALYFHTSVCNWNVCTNTPPPAETPACTRTHTQVDALGWWSHLHSGSSKLRWSMRLGDEKKRSLVAVQNVIPINLGRDIRSSGECSLIFLRSSEKTEIKNHFLHPSQNPGHWPGHVYVNLLICSSYVLQCVMLPWHNPSDRLWMMR